MSHHYLTQAAISELRAKLTEHDRQVLDRVSALRFVTGAQLTRLCFVGGDSPAANARAARRALLRLTRLGVLARLPRAVGGVRAGSAGFIYHLGYVGQRLVNARRQQPGASRRRSRVPGMLFVHHALAVAELHTLLVEGDRSRRFELLELTSEPACWRPFGGVAGHASILKPDSYVRLADRAYEYHYFIEVDRGTEGSHALDRQLQLYLAYYLAGSEQAEHGIFPRVLWLAPNTERVQVIEGCIEQLPSWSRELFRVSRFEQAIDAIEQFTREVT
jgi:hypothetical protein